MSSSTGREFLLLTRTLISFVLLVCLSVVSISSFSEELNSQQADFLKAARQGDLQQLEKNLKKGVSIEARDNHGRTALLIATHENHIELAKHLINLGADVNARDNINDTPYLYAGAEGRLEILQMTVNAGADLSSVNRYGGTALIPAAHHGHVKTVEYLLTTNTDIDHINHLGWTALLEAIILGDGSEIYIQIVSLLVEAGADVNIADSEGITPLAHAIQRNYVEIVNLLSVAGAK
jgi:ankyrin repeat protein